MNKATRKTVIAGNWKMNMTPSSTKAFITELAPMVAGKDGCDIVLCVPFVDIAPAVEAAKGTNIKIGAENVHFAKSGAYTGEISADMLNEVGAEYVVIGHSERRQYFGETNETVNLRVKAALEGGLKVILCVGELLAEREQGITEEIVSLQTKIALQGVSADELKNVIIAYEPVWAIGTGKTATPEQADEVCGIIRGVIAKLYSAEAAEAFTVQYGGSMNAKNAAELLSKVNVDGGLIGGASLKTADFTTIVNAAQYRSLRGGNPFEKGFPPPPLLPSFIRAGFEVCFFLTIHFFVI
ncbi:MAG: triose-phosphate isomerase [Eubacteriales bacterium]